MARYNYEHIKVGDKIIIENVGNWGTIPSIVTEIQKGHVIRFTRDDGDKGSISYPSDGYNVIVLKEKSKAHSVLESL